MSDSDLERTLRRGVEDHYGDSTGLAERVLGALREQGIDPASVPFDEIPAHDELHLRGRAATVELAELGNLAGPLTVLDLGSGLGGSARFLAARFHCRVVGADLTQEFCRSASTLSAAFGMRQLTHFTRADATRLPFADDSFPVVWTQHTQMNVMDKAAFYREALRVLEPGGQFLFHDIFAAADEAPEFPLPWAPRPELSHLVPADRVAAFLREKDLQCVQWRDRTLPTIAWLRDLIARADRAVMMRASREQKMGNVLSALESGKLQVVQARWDAPPTDAS